MFCSSQFTCVRVQNPPHPIQLLGKPIPLIISDWLPTVLPGEINQNHPFLLLNDTSSFYISYIHPFSSSPKLKLHFFLFLWAGEPQSPVPMPNHPKAVTVTCAWCPREPWELFLHTNIDLECFCIECLPRVGGKCSISVPHPSLKIGFSQAT